MKNNKNRQLPVFRLTALAMSLCAAQSSVYAMQALNEQDTCVQCARWYYA
jgi:hypothetical protein